jgi:hypothetical protein
VTITVLKNTIEAQLISDRVLVGKIQVVSLAAGLLGTG